ncbi:MAG: ATP-binding protein [bacterium]
MPLATLREALTRRLGFRLGLFLVLGSVAILGVIGVWNVALHRRQLTHLVEVQATQLAGVVRRSTHEAMLRNDSRALRGMVDALASEKDVQRIRVFDKQGRISISTERTEEGQPVDMDAEQCVSCHGAGRPLERLTIRERTRIFGPAGRRVLGVIAPVQNEPACSNASCHAHPPEKTILGVLDVQLSLDEVDASVAASERQLVFALSLTALLLLGLSGVVTWRLVLKPVHQLTSAAPLVAAADFSVRVPSLGHDEIGKLVDAWNAMVEDLGETHARLADANRTLEERIAAKTQALEKAHRQMVLVEKMASLGKLAAVVAHEINNPLAGVVTYARLLRRRHGEDPVAASKLAGPDTERILELIESETVRCGNIVRNLLLFSRAPTAHFASADVKQLLERCALLVGHRLELQELTLETRIAPELPAIVCDAAQCQQVMLALLMNAIDATPPGGRITLAAAPRGDGGVRLEVADTGRGIPPEVLPRIFEPFFTTKEAGAGVGLGLAVVYGIVERHHGLIDVVSAPGEGAKFIVELPADPRAAPSPDPSPKA